jgi:hypothetical protein
MGHEDGPGKQRGTGNGSHQLPVYADDVNILGENTSIIGEKKEVILDAKKEVSLEFNK